MLTDVSDPCSPRAAPAAEQTNALWQVAHVSGSGASAEYLLINSMTGYFMTATG